MFRIAELKRSNIDNTIDYAIYREGSNNFNRWYLLILEKMPNVDEIKCNDNDLEHINIGSFENIKKLYCFGNKLKSLNFVFLKYLDCSNNLLTNIDGPNLESLACCNNLLVSINTPNVKTLYCWNNKLEYLDLPKAKIIYCNSNNLQYINAPKAIVIHCCGNPNLEYIIAPKLKKLCYDIYYNKDQLIQIPLHFGLNLYDKYDNPIKDDIQSKFRSGYIKSANNV